MEGAGAGAGAGIGDAGVGAGLGAGLDDAGIGAGMGALPAEGMGALPAEGMGGGGAKLPVEGDCILLPQQEQKMPVTRVPQQGQKVPPAVLCRTLSRKGSGALRA